MRHSKNVKVVVTDTDLIRVGVLSGKDNGKRYILTLDHGIVIVTSLGEDDALTLRSDEPFGEGLIRLACKIGLAVHHQMTRSEIVSAILAIGGDLAEANEIADIILHEDTDPMSPAEALKLVKARRKIAEYVIGA